MKCEQCQAYGVAAFVHYGSYFTQCVYCGQQGPATSWLAISPHMASYLKAVAVNSNQEPLETVAKGNGSDVIQATSKAAASGKLVRLYGKHDGA